MFCGAPRSLSGPVCGILIIYELIEWTSFMQGTTTTTASELPELMLLQDWSRCVDGANVIYGGEGYLQQ